MSPVTSPSSGCASRRGAAGRAAARPGRCRRRAARRRPPRARAARRSATRRGRVPRARPRRARRARRRAVHDEVGIAPDRRREVAVGRRGETGVAEVLRGVARLLERAQQQRLNASPVAGRRGRSAQQVGLPRHRRAPRRGPSARARRGRHAEVGQASTSASRLGLGPLVDAVDRRAPQRSRSSATSSLARIISSSIERVGARLRLPARPDHPAVLELEHELERVDRERAAARSAARAARAPGASASTAARRRAWCRGPRGSRAPGGTSAARRCGSASGRRAARPARGRRRRHLDADGAPIAPLLQAAHAGGELVRQHRLDPPGHVDREGAAARLAVDRAAGRTWNATSAMCTHRRSAVALAGERSRRRSRAPSAGRP